MDDKVKEKSRLADRAWNVVTEIVAPLVWIYSILQIFVVDCDHILFSLLPASVAFYQPYKVVFVLVAISCLWLLVGSKQFWLLVLYIFIYPIVFICRILALIFKRSPFVAAFAPALYEIALTFKATFALISFGLVSCCLIYLSAEPIVIIASQLLLGILLIIQLFRSFRRAFRTSVFSSLAGLTKKFRLSFENGAIDEYFVKSQEQQKVVIAPEIRKSQHLTQLYLFNWACEFLDEKLSLLTKERYPDVYLIASLLWTFFLTTIVFSFEYFGLWKIYPESFSNASVANYWSFLGLSFSLISGSGLAKVLPQTGSATLICHLESVCHIGIGIVLVFSLFSTTRERYKDDIGVFIGEVRHTTKSVQDRINLLYQLTLAQVEGILLTDQQQFINLLRKLRGLPQLELEEKAESKVIEIEGKE
jgi:hypothetical protein